MLAGVGDVRPWSDPNVVAINRLAMRVPLTPYPNANSARSAGRSPWRLSLDGKWGFTLYPHPDTVPSGAIAASETVVDKRVVVPESTDPATDFLDSPSAPTEIAVPGNWTVQGVADYPHYTNVQMPWPLLPPELPEANPTGVYRRTFDLPPEWNAMGVVLHIGAAESVHAVYVNGHFAGYGTDSRLASEYDITAHLHPGTNTLAVVVVRYSAQSYVEDQDQWWMAGLHRHVFLEARNDVHINDVNVDAAADGSITVRTVIGFRRQQSISPGYTLTARLETMDGRRLDSVHRCDVPVDLAPYVFRGHVCSLSWIARGVQTWSAETPRRYRLLVTLHAPDGTGIETTEVIIGFRSVEVIDRDLIVNGKRVMIRGVNRHDHHPDRGKAVTYEDMRDDLLAMKRHNINAIRCSHYPNDPHLLDMCDELGFYVVDEANIESHAFNTSLCDDHRYSATWLARGSRMVQRDRNHPCVILWSLGNESGFGVNHVALAAWIRRTDPTRPLFYEGAILHEGWIDGGLRETDIVCPMYSTIDAVRTYGASGAGSRPLIMSEYSHAMGNSNGSLADYWEVFESTPGLQGGFVWEWKDHGIRQRLADGRERFAYGGQFGDQPNDGNFVADGLMASDLQPHPALRELTWCHRPVAVAASPTGLHISNRQSFRDLQWLMPTWSLAVDGVVVKHGALNVPSLEAGSSCDIPMPTSTDTFQGEVMLTVNWATRTDRSWAARGHTLAWDQILVRRQSRQLPVGSTPPVEPTPELSVWRAATDNDGFKMMKIHHGGGTSLARWQKAGFDRRPAGELFEHQATRRILQNGAQLWEHRVEVPEVYDDLPRLGVTFAVPLRFAKLRWYGRGPHECYPDRQSSAIVGLWEQGIDTLPYLLPQEFGLRTDCRWFNLTDPSSGETLRISAEWPTTMHVSATRYTADDLFQASDQSELRERDEIIVHIDVAHRGVGTASCGPDTLPRYLVRAGTHHLSYRLESPA